MYIVRHGFSDHNAHNPGVFDVGDPGLHPIGKRQAEEAAGWLAAYSSIDVVVTAPNTRSYETGRRIARETGALLATHEGFGEYDWGTWAGMPTAQAFTEAEQQRADAQGWNFLPNPESETRRAARLRFAHAVIDTELDYPDATVAVVTSSFVSKCYVGGQLGMPAPEVRELEMRNAGVYAFDPSAQQIPRFPTALFSPQNQPQP